MVCTGGDAWEAESNHTRLWADAPQAGFGFDGIEDRLSFLSFRREVFSNLLLEDFCVECTGHVEDVGW